MAELKVMLAAAQEELASKDRSIRALQATLEKNGLSYSKSLTLTEQPSYSPEVHDELVQEMERVRDRLSDEVSEHSSLKAVYNELLREHALANEELKNTQQVCKLQKEAVQNAEARRRTAEESLEQLQETVQALKTELQQVNTAKSQLEQQLLQQTLKVDQLRLDVRPRPRSPFPLAAIEEEEDENFVQSKELKALTERFNAYRAALSQGEQALVQRSELLERNLEKLTLMYYVLVDQKSQLKVSNHVNERRVTRLQLKNQELQNEVDALKDKLMEERYQAKLMSDQLEQSSLQGRNSLSMSGVFAFAKNIRRTIKGGGGKSGMFISSIYS